MCFCVRLGKEEIISPPNAPATWPLVAYTGLVILLTVGMLLLSWLLGERHHGREMGEPYESGIPTVGSPYIPFSVDFYLVALFFLVFDLEAAFLFAWAVSARELGWSGYWGVLIFISVLAVILVYEWKTGALKWGPSSRVSQPTRRLETAPEARLEGGRA